MIATFMYDKEDGEPARRRFVRVNSSDLYYVKGVDLVDGIPKTFLFNRIFYWQPLAENFSDGKLITRPELYAKLGWSKDASFIADCVSDEKLVELVSSKLNLKVVTAYGVFILLGEKFVKFDVVFGNKNFNIVIYADRIEFLNGFTVISEADFRTLVLTGGKK